jgi:C-terminal processing protease CtpA/Prc
MTYSLWNGGRWLALAAAMLLLAVPLAAQNDDIPMAEIENDAGGPVIIRGQMDYTNPLLTLGVAQPIVMLEDQAGFVDRDLGFIFPPESQVLGNFTSDFFTSPVDYNINLPIEPRGTLRDVDNDEDEDTGVMVYTPAYWNNVFGDPFLEERDVSGGGWSGAYAGTDVNSETEVVGGIYVIYAPEDGQGFPAGFGDDGLLFTEDDPIVAVPQGWTIVDLDTDPFTFDRSREAEIDLLEPTSAALDDFSNLSYTEAFDAMVDLLEREYAFTEYKEIDWDALVEAYRPRVEAAEAEGNAFEFKLAIRDFSYEIPDGHVAVFGSGMQELNALFQQAISGGLGLNLTQLEDGRVIVSFLLEDGPAANAQMQLGDEILEVDGTPIEEALANTFIFNGFSADHLTRIQQLRYIVRRPLGEQVAITFRDSDTGDEETVTLTTVNEVETFNRSSIVADAPRFTQPVEFEQLDNGYAYVSVNTFSDNEVLTVQQWEYFLTRVNDAGIEGIVIDMRFNGGGSGQLADGLAGYFYEENTAVGFIGFYNDELGRFDVREERPDTVYAAPEVFRYAGEVAILVGPACASACEFFSYSMAQLDNVAVVGQYPSQGLGGGVNDFFMPEGLRFRYTASRGLNSDMEIHIEGIGVVPDIAVPITEETVFSDEDLVLQAALDYLDGQLTVPSVDGEPLGVGDSVAGMLNAGERVRHTVTGPANSVDVAVEAEETVEVVLRVYTEDGEFLGDAPAEIPGLPLQADVIGETVIVEVSVAGDNAATDYTISVEPSN